MGMLVVMLAPCIGVRLKWQAFSAAHDAMTVVLGILAQTAYILSRSAAE